jgi:hypothetical protein
MVVERLPPTLTHTKCIPLWLSTCWLIPSYEPVKTDWAQYDQAQIYEMTNYLNNIRDLVNLADKRIKERTPPRKRGPGRLPTYPANVAKALLLQTYVDSSNRLAEVFLLLFQEKLGISSSFSYLFRSMVRALVPRTRRITPINDKNRILRRIIRNQSLQSFRREGAGRRQFSEIELGWHKKKLLLCSYGRGGST